ncbi:MAG: signal peptidase II [Legionellales bacterium]|nr:signal peptidase II [Legionellales bacterium]
MRKWPWFLLTLLVIGLDQGTKIWAAYALYPYQPEAIVPVLNLTLAYNSGVAFSFLSGFGPWHRWVFAGFSFCMSVALIVGILRTATVMRLQLLALSLILGGAIGNFIDRVSVGAVIDFIDVYYHQHHWPVFNLADSAICLGAFLLFIQGISFKDA